MHLTKGVLKMIANDILCGAVDMHVHAAPDVQPRKYDEWQLQDLYHQAGMAGYVSKCHAGDTAARAALLMKRRPPVTIYGSIVLNRPVGGLNAAAVEASAHLGGRVVWFPTVDRIPIWDEAKKLLPAVFEILDCIKAYDLILATGHLPPEQALALLQAAKERGLKRLIATHVSLPLTAADLIMQRQYLACGAVLEHCWYTPFHHLSSIEAIAASIRQAGPTHGLLSSDMGQPDGLTPPQGLLQFAAALEKAGISQKDLRTMLVGTPQELLS